MSDYINKIHNIDCLLGMSSMPDNSVDLIITSPPYNVNDGKDRYENIKDSVSQDDYYEFLNDVIYQCLRIARYTFFNIQPLTNNKGAIFKLIGKYEKDIKEIIIWNKKHFVPTNEGVLNSAYEFIIVFSKDSPDRRFSHHYIPVGQVSNVWDIDGARKKEKIQLTHNAVFPLELPEKIIKLFSHEEELILDPFMGTGTTAVASKRLNRNYLGFEINPEYIKIAESRLSQTTLNNNNYKEVLE